MRVDILPRYMAQYDAEEAESRYYLQDNVSLDELLEVFCDRASTDAPFRKAFLLNSPLLFPDPMVLLQRLLGIVSAAGSPGSDQPLSEQVRCADIKTHLWQQITDWCKDYGQDFNRSDMQELLSVRVKQDEKWVSSLRSTTRLALVRPRQSSVSLEAAPLGPLAESKVSRDLSLDSLTQELHRLNRRLDVLRDLTLGLCELENSHRPLLSLEDLKRVETSHMPFADAARELLTCSARDLAAHLTLVDLAYLCALPLRDFVGARWVKPEFKEACKGLLRMIAVFNSRANWVATLILKAASDAERTAWLKLLIDTADELKGMNNFFGVFALITGFTRSPVSRLKATHWHLPGPFLTRLNALQELTSRNRNSRAYRVLFSRSRGKPQIPHLSVLCADVFALEDLSPTFDRETKNVNFEKFWNEWQLLTESVTECQALSAQYNFQKKDSVLVPLLATLQPHAIIEDDDELSNLSYQLLAPPPALLKALQLQKKQGQKNVNKYKYSISSKADV